MLRSVVGASSHVRILTFVVQPETPPTPLVFHLFAVAGLSFGAVGFEVFGSREVVEAQNTVYVRGVVVAWMLCGRHRGGEKLWRDFDFFFRVAVFLYPFFGLASLSMLTDWAGARRCDTPECVL